MGIRGILSEIGDITAFHSSDALPKYAGLYCTSQRIPGISFEDNQMSKVESFIFATILAKRQQRQEAHP